ncbi:Cilia- and flagella-associated protein 47, partial [Quaeritorhiza haematococci]
GEHGKGGNVEMIHVPKGRRLRWVYPLKGEPEYQIHPSPPLHLECRAQETLEKDVDVTLHEFVPAPPQTPADNSNASAKGKTTGGTSESGDIICDFEYKLQFVSAAAADTHHTTKYHHPQQHHHHPQHHSHHHAHHHHHHPHPHHHDHPTHHDEPSPKGATPPPDESVTKSIRLTLKSVHTDTTSPPITDPKLKFKIHFAPKRAFQAPSYLAHLVVLYKPQGAIWRYPIRVGALAPVVDDVIVVEAGGGGKDGVQPGYVSFTLRNPEAGELPFKAYFLKDSPAELGVMPMSGVLVPGAPKDGGSGNTFIVSYKPTEGPKEVAGILMIEVSTWFRFLRLAF